jgi:integrase
MRGSIQKRKAKDGTISYSILFDVPPKTGQARRQKRIRGFLTRKDAERKLRHVLANLDRNGCYEEPTKLSVGQYADKWLTEIESHVKQRTLLTYRRWLLDYLVPRIGELPMIAVRAQRMKDVYAELLQRGRKRSRKGSFGLHPQSVLHIHRVAHGMFSDAVDAQLIDTNPCANISRKRLPKVPVSPQRCLDEEEARRLLKAAENTPLHAFVTLGLYTGARAGELVSLSWPNCDLDNGRITIAFGQARDGSLSSPKTDRSRRTIQIPPAAVSILRVYKARQKLAMGESWSDRQFVFCDKIGRPWRVASISHAFRPIVTQAGLGSDVHMHTLRHTYASLSLKGGVPVTTVSSNLGHASARTTLNVYAHHIPTNEDPAAKVMQAVLTTST